MEPRQHQKMIFIVYQYKVNNRIQYNFLYARHPQQYLKYGDPIILRMKQFLFCVYFINRMGKECLYC